MILRDKCVMLHMPKTGGVFIRLLLEKHYPDDVLLGDGGDFDRTEARWEQHHSIADVGSKESDLPVFGFVRNPWDWYVSWYHFFMTYPHKPPTFMKLSEDKTLDFADFMARWLAVSPDSEEYADNSFSAKYFRIFGANPAHPQNPNIEIGRYETIHADLQRFLTRVGLSAACIADVPGFRTFNPSKHDRYWTYYTDELAEQVYERDREFIDAFAYTLERQ